MAYQSLYRTWRPQTFSEMVGQEAIVRALSNQADSRRVAHAYLFCGSRGTGKTSAARIMAMAINCENPAKGDPCLQCASCKALRSETTLDVFEMDAASNSRVEEIREMLARTDYPPQFVKYKVYIIDEVHMLSNAAFNALLKTLEEPPEYMVFILATTEPQKLPATILSRCQRYDFGRISESDIISRLKQALTDGAQAEEEALHLIAAAAQGSMRDAWSLMDMCLSAQQDLTAQNVRLALGAVSEDFLYAFLDALHGGDTAQALRLCDELMKGGRDVQVFLREFNAHTRQVLAVKWTGRGIRDTTADQLARLQAQARGASADVLLFILEQCMQSEQDSRWSMSPRAVLELFALRCTRMAHREDGTAPVARPSAKENRPEVQAAPTRADAEPPAAPQALPLTPGPKQAPEPAPAPPVPEKILEDDRHTAGAEAIKTTSEPDTPSPSEPRIGLAPPAETAKPLEKAAAKTPKEAWNSMLKRLENENPGLHAMVSQGKYGGYEEGVFHLKMDRKDSIYSSLLNAQERSEPIELLLAQEMGQAVRFVAGSAEDTGKADARKAVDEHLEALSKAFGRDKIILKKD